MMMMMNPQSTANQSSAAAAAATATATAGLESFYLEDYLDCVENLPEDLQRNISHMRELDATYQEILRELESHQLNLQGLTDETESGERTRKRILVHLQRALIQLQEIFDEKLEIAQQILDMIENKSRQLDVDYRNIGMRAMNIGGGRENDNSEQSFSKADVQPERSSKRARRQRNECLGQGAATFGAMTAAAGMVVAREDHSTGHHAHQPHLHQGSDDAEEKDRTTSSMIASGSGSAAAAAATSVTATTATMLVGVSAVASSSSSSGAIAASASVVSSHHVSAIASSSMAASSASSSSATAVSATLAAPAVTSANTSSTVKKAKKKKRRSKAEMHVDRHQTSFSLHLRGDSSLSSGGANMASSLVVDDPLIDPDEPTYCLCQQISYGEMIGCDNDRCSIEWFHFSCVGLTTKPKGKWFCPRCRGDRPNVPRPGVRA